MVFTHPFEVPMNHVVVMEVLQALGDIVQLGKRVRTSPETVGRKPARMRGFFSGCAVTYSVRSLLGIQTETIWGGSRVAPRKGTIFLCFKRFHTATFSQSTCGGCFEGGNSRKNGHVTHPLHSLQVTIRIHPYPLDAHLGAVKGSLVHVGQSTGGER